MIFLNGRYFCGNFCPRGAFYGTILQPIGKKGKIPNFLHNNIFRCLVFVILFGLFVFQLIRLPFTLKDLSFMFWLMCTITTSVGIVLGVFFSYRTWCAFCPIGTIVNIFGKDRHQLVLDKNLCIGGKLCEKHCPLDVAILINPQDCIKCGKCINICPKKSLSFKK